MKVVTHREMRNSSGEILRAVAAGESFVITNNGVPVAELAPIGTQRPARPARIKGRFSEIPRISLPTGVTAQQILDELREDRI